MEVDVSDYDIGGVLSMECEDKKQRPVDFPSKSLNEIERETMRFMTKRCWQL